ncbi:hypothetical protein NLJ89_g5171 [Agrocybe chaxingu]|uniref:Uncharacterized protein n=1 Tax=Agrocybe chaxingu TaxID=84603 RepID=A0A9W8MVV2_9AGAR|nr:hypothetical protein NLJ89_g5171 [Agrocybe chaxingu]
MASDGLPSGTYYVTHVQSGKVLDLTGSSVQPNTPLIVYIILKSYASVFSRQWILEKEGDIYTFQTSLANVFARASVHTPGKGIVIGRVERFEVLEQEIGQYRIKVRDQNLVWTIDNASTPNVILEPSGVTPNGDLWSFEEISS